jgi:hypothetical protein
LARIFADPAAAFSASGRQSRCYKEIVSRIILLDAKLGDATRLDLSYSSSSQTRLVPIGFHAETSPAQVSDADSRAGLEFG